MKRSEKKRLRLSSMNASSSQSQLQSEEQNKSQESVSLMAPEELVKQIKELDQLYEIDIEGTSDQENFPEVNEGIGSGVSEPLATEDVTMNDPGSSSAIGSALQVAGSSGAEMPSSSADDKPLPEKSDEQLTDDEHVRIKFLKAILDGKDEKARNDMKARMSGVIGQSSLEYYLRRDALYALCEEYLQLLKQQLTKVATCTYLDLEEVGQIVKHAGNLSWLADILIRGEIAEDVIELWVSQTELSDAYYKLAAPYRYEVLRVTTTLLMWIGTGKLQVNKKARYSLLKTWFGPLCDDFEWMRKFKGVNKKLIEHGLGGAIFSLPAKVQHEFLLVWIDKLLNSGKECPQLRSWFELWWSKAFW